jgi:PHD/YefM family antitoxin component YafN of YafNO toxin-antitoxin module
MMAELLRSITDRRRRTLVTDNANAHAQVTVVDANAGRVLVKTHFELA